MLLKFLIRQVICGLSHIANMIDDLLSTINSRWISFSLVLYFVRFLVIDFQGVKSDLDEKQNLPVWDYLSGIRLLLIICTLLYYKDF